MDKNQIIKKLNGVYIMYLNLSKEKCKHCGKNFKVVIETLPSKMDDKRESYYYCPYCEKAVDTVRLQGNEEVHCEKI